MSELIGQAVDRFLRWKLPEDFAPDGGISFDPHRLGSPRLSPTGTNLLNAIQAEAMLEHVAAPLLARIAELEDLLTSVTPQKDAEGIILKAKQTLGGKPGDSLIQLCLEAVNEINHLKGGVALLKQEVRDLRHLDPEC